MLFMKKTILIFSDNVAECFHPEIGWEARQDVCTCIHFVTITESRKK